MNDTFTAYDPAVLPAPVVAYLDAHDEKRYADVAALFAPGATVLDDGKTYEGIEAIRAWSEKSSAEYTYTSTRIGQRTADGSQVTVRVQLDGNFPGGTVVLRYRFTLRAGLIGDLAIEV